ncbi:hypothetical protein [Microlunatus endophyticus]|uniref:hypothetical protein n=1 Tax=Microlunatus endophyticus TaxID=1716077 RepID=UPI0016651248|nr:hypothetical protein [Microlunatus endophyticus]
MPVNAVAPYLEFALPFYETRDSAHNAAHIRRIVGRLDDLSDGVDPAPRAAFLHFLASFHGLASRVAHDREFDQQVRELLAELDWTEPEIDEAYVLLERHCVDPQTSEECIVHDANYIEVLGAFGVAKAFTKGGAERQSYEQTMEIFRRNLHRVEFKTPRGQAIAAEGRSYADGFLDRLRGEL